MKIHQIKNLNGTNDKKFGVQILKSWMTKVNCKKHFLYPVSVLVSCTLYGQNLNQNQNRPILKFS